MRVTSRSPLLPLLLTALMVSLYACTSTVTVHDSSFGISCGPDTTGSGTGANYCICGLSSSPNDVACDETSSEGTCCATPDWPQPSASYSSSSPGCACSPNTISAFHCDAGLVSNSGTSSCNCSPSLGGTATSCSIATGNAGVCCFDPADNFCNCSRFTTSCATGQTKVAACNAALVPPVKHVCSFSGMSKSVPSCTAVPFSLDAASDAGK